MLCLERPVQYIIEMAISVCVAFIISFVIYKDKKEETVSTAAVAGSAARAGENTPSDTVENTAENGASGMTEEVLNSPVKGRIIRLSEVSDETFASEMLGATVAVEPENGRIVAPCDGEIINIFETGHAVCLATKSGGELLIHVGVDTVKLEGKGFTKKVSDGDVVRAGDVLIEADLDVVKAAGYPVTIMVILTNADQYSKVNKSEPKKVGTETAVMTVKK